VQLFLGENAQLSTEEPTEESVRSYQSDIVAMQEDADPEELHFKYTFTKRTYLLGSAKAVLYVSCQDQDDMDVFVQLRKVDKAGNVLISYNVPLPDLARMGMAQDQIPKVNPMIYLGPAGHLRASHRALDKTLSKPHWPIHAHDREEPVPAGTVVKLEIGIWPGGMIFSEGESLLLKVSGHWMTLAEYPWLRGTHTPKNKGKHNVHLGGKKASHVVLPFVDI
jgi:uncharacterized protein